MGINFRTPPVEITAFGEDLRRTQHKKAAFIFLLCAFTVYSALFIFRTSDVFEGKRYFMLFDDAMVSMKYARNLAAGQGLVWNAGGERVEGFTNPLWVVYMSLFHLLPIDPSKVSLFIQISGWLFLILNLVVVRKIARMVSEDCGMVTLTAVALTAFYLPLNNWGLQGTEVSVLTFLCTFCVYQAVRYVQSGNFPRMMYVVLGISTLIRPDAVIVALALTIFLAYHVREDRNRHLVYGIVSLAIFLTFQTVFRYVYYGELLPNTYYLKMTGYPLFLRMTRGLFTFLWYAWHMNFILFAVPFVVAYLRRDPAVRLMFWVLAAQFGYSIFVGGDAWEGRGGANRYIAVVLPLFFILFAIGAERIISALLANFRKPSRMQTALPVACILIILAQFNSFYGVPALAEAALIKRPLNVDDNINMMHIAMLVKKYTHDPAKVAVVWAGNTPYFSDRFSIDLLGKSDKKIARLQMRMPRTHQRLERDQISLPPGFFKYIAFYPGHLKWDYTHSIGSQKPDVIVQLYRSPEEAAPLIEGKYKSIVLEHFRIMFGVGSENVKWKELEEAGKMPAVPDAD